MYPGFVSSGLGMGKTTFVHLIQFQCTRDFYENLRFIKRGFYFCENINLYRIYWIELFWMEGVGGGPTLFTMAATFFTTTANSFIAG